MPFCDKRCPRLRQRPATVSHKDMLTASCLELELVLAPLTTPLSHKFPRAYQPLFQLQSPQMQPDRHH